MKQLRKDYLEKILYILSRNQQFTSQESAVEAWSTYKQFVDKPAVQYVRIGIANMKLFLQVYCLSDGLCICCHLLQEEAFLFILRKSLTNELAELLLRLISAIFWSGNSGFFGNQFSLIVFCWRNHLNE